MNQNGDSYVLGFLFIIIFYKMHCQGIYLYHIYRHDQRRLRVITELKLSLGKCSSERL